MWKCDWQCCCASVVSLARWEKRTHGGGTSGHRAPWKWDRRALLRSCWHTVLPGRRGTGDRYIDGPNGDGREEVAAALVICMFLWLLENHIAAFSVASEADRAALIKTSDLGHKENSLAAAQSVTPRFLKTSRCRRCGAERNTEPSAPCASPTPSAPGAARGCCAAGKGAALRWYRALRGYRSRRGSGRRSRPSASHRRHRPAPRAQGFTGWPSAAWL